MIINIRGRGTYDNNAASDTISLLYDEHYTNVYQYLILGNSGQLTYYQIRRSALEIDQSNSAATFAF